MAIRGGSEACGASVGELVGKVTAPGSAESACSEAIFLEAGNVKGAGERRLLITVLTVTRLEELGVLVGELDTLVVVKG